MTVWECVLEGVIKTHIMLMSVEENLFLFWFGFMRGRKERQ